MNILYCGDSNIENGVIMSVLSLLNNVDDVINVYILTAGIKTRDKTYSALQAGFGKMLDELLKSKNPKNSACVLDITELFNNCPPKANIETRFTPCCMLRLYADCVEALPEKLLYLDNDVICRKDFSDFYNQDMSEYELCGVLDYYGRWFFRNRIFSADYINSGVLLLNLSKIRETGLFRECRKRCAQKQMFMPDQSAINKLAQNKKICKRIYNEQRRLKKETVFQHFTTSFRFFPIIKTVSVKPWDIERVHDVLKINEYDTLFDEYNRVKMFYSDNQKEF